MIVRDSTRLFGVQEEYNKVQGFQLKERFRYKNHRRKAGLSQALEHQPLKPGVWKEDQLPKGED
jgi:hypothetical protein